MASGAHDVTGRPGRPAISSMIARDWPDTNREAASCCTQRMPRSSRSVVARCTAAPTHGRSSELTTWISRAPSARAAITAPSSTRCGATSSSALSLALAGSPSAALTTT